MRPRTISARARSRRGHRGAHSAGERRIIGVMIESHLVEGRQDLSPGKPLKFGQSVTDACLGWEDSAKLLEILTEAVRKRRKHRR
jgi:3-deoxy-7-phosphoheptulonate synthase